MGLGDDLCLLYQNHTETVFHVFRECIYIQKVLTTVGFFVPLPFGPFLNCHEWICAALLDRERLTHLVTLLWSIWNPRNRWVHDAKLTPACFVDDIVKTFLANVVSACLTYVDTLADSGA
ncbi:hypothetical protein V6N11_037252 [Hibiscus sabdariffa]|uniref:Reverse transcriptase zinc-binding domain-containing protein n=1 Tax=Hibiscus sabdariffa TaxID=183260 RepID=A0ABR2P0U0_9ROSI